jgi:hypothetical protein
MQSFLTDEVLRQLMAVGQVDVLVGLPTFNHAATVGAVVRAVHVAFAGPLKRERTVLLSLDGGSTDGTLDVVREASLVQADTVIAPQPLRTLHRITAPYHGLPGKAGSLRLLFATAELLDAKAIAVSIPRPSLPGLGRRSCAGPKWGRLRGPVLARAPFEGPSPSSPVPWWAGLGRRVRAPGQRARLPAASRTAGPGRWSDPKAMASTVGSPPPLSPATSAACRRRWAHRAVAARRARGPSVPGGGGRSPARG